MPLPQQGDLGKLEKWVLKNLMKFYKFKFQVLHPGWGNPRHEHRLGVQVTENIPLKKDLGILVEKLDITQQCELSAQDNCIQGSFQSSMSSRVREGNLPLYITLMRLHLESWVQLQGPQHKKKVDLLEWVQRRP